MRLTTLALSVFLVCLASPLVWAESATVSWDPNTESDLAGYKIYYGVNSHNYDNVIDVGNVTSFTVTGLTAGVTYYFAVTAYDFSNNESGFSAEVSTMVGGDTNPPDLVDIFVNGDTQLDVIFSEPLERTSAETIANYTISNGVEVLGAVLDDGDLSTVRLITTSHVRGQTYVMTVNNITDLEGNPIPAGTSKSYDIPSPSDDTLPPQLVLVEVVDASHLNVVFNEPVEETSAENIDNYSIDNGVQVLQAVLQSNLSVVQLTTTQHEPNLTYTLTVTRVYDRAPVPNIIAEDNSYSYEINSGGSDDTLPPRLMSVLINGSTQIDLNFNEALEETSAQDKANYIITPGIQVIGAILDANQTTVHLVTSKHIDGKEYTLILNNIRDLAEPPNPIESNTSYQYVYNSDGDFPDNPNNTAPEFQPRSFALFQNYPNPFNPETEIRFFLEKDRDVKLIVYNTLGQRVKVVVNDLVAAGYHTVVWDGTNSRGMKVPSGVYIYSLEIKRDIVRNSQLVNVTLERRVKKMTLLR